MSETSDPRKALSNRRTVFMGLALLAVVLAVFLLGKIGILPDADSLIDFMNSMASSPFGLPALILVFCVAIYLGIPQFALIAMAVGLFGPWLGFLYAWIANLCSGALTFWTGRLTGEQAFRRYAGDTANKLSGFVGRNAFITSAIVRNVPAGPALLVNMAFGVSHAKFTHYIAGLGLGVLPKIALIAFAGQSLLSALKGNPVVAIAAAAAAIAVYAGIAIYARNRLSPRRQSVPLIEPETVDTQTDERK